MQNQKIIEQEGQAVRTMSFGTNNTDNKEFVSAVSKNVWVLETYNPIDKTMDSSLMTKEEIDWYNYASAVQQENSDTNSIQALAEDDEEDWTKNDTTKKHRLTITLEVVYDSENEIYEVVGTASWVKEWVFFWEGDAAAEETAEDYMIFTWGETELLNAQKIVFMVITTTE